MNEDIVTPAYITYRKKKSPFRMVTIFLAIALIISCGSILSFLLYSTGLGISPRKATITYYAVSFGQFVSSDDANAFAQDMQLKGGAGVIYGSQNHVLCSVYKSKSQASKVIGNNTDYHCEIVEIHISKQHSTPLKIVDNLLQISIDYDQTKDLLSTKTALQDLSNTLPSLTQDTTNKLVQEYYIHTSSLISAILPSTSNYGYSIKYVALSCLIELKNMSES
ncbi:MAG: hypothetical protein ACLRFG_02840 [Clostridia bacterium]